MISPAGSAGSNANNYFAAPLEGIRRGMAQAGEAAEKMARGDLSPENVVAQIQAEVLVKANVAVMRTTQEILGSIIDLKA
jgi:hypothetical protein